MTFNIGVVGAGVMGANLALNFAGRGRSVVLFDRDVEKAATAASAHERLSASDPSPEALVDALAAPRLIVLLTPAGAPTDAAIDALAPRLDAGDVLIDCGNADFNDTERRAAALAAEGRAFLGVGVSGGAEGARLGPALMAGGDREAWDRAAPIFDEAAARFGDAPCCAWLGPGGAGHFIKTMHNGVEYADMQMIAEVYALLRDRLGAAPREISDIFAAWNDGPLGSYLIEIAAKVAAAVDPRTGAPMLDVIEDTAGQKGTGRWSAIEALKLGAPAPAIEAAVAARNISAKKAERVRLEALYGLRAEPKGGRFEDQFGGRAGAVDAIEQALLAGKLLAYAQGFAVLAAGSAEHDWGAPLGTVARIWRAGCIIRAKLLDEIADALDATPSRSLLEAPAVADRLRSLHASLRRVVAAAALSETPTPALAASLAYFDAARQARGSATMIQAQRDFFGAHGFRRVDAEGDHHGPW